MTEYKVGQEVYSPNYMSNLTVVAVDSAGAMLSADGKSYSHEFHKGPETGEPVYVEAKFHEGRDFHGWIDSISRKITQTG